jgi:intein-encoded DNA endonuclease-like protein
LQGVGATGIAKIIHCSPMPLKNMLLESGIKIRNCEESHDFQKKHIKEDYFDMIDHQDKAYMLGLWFADGCNHVGDKKKEYAVALTLQASDIALLERIREKLEMERKINVVTRESDGRSYARLEFKNKHISLRFCELGIVPRKTFITQFPDYLSDDLIPHFIRGLLDGDGCISHNLKTIQFAGSHKMMCGLVDQFQKHLGFTAHIVQIKHSPGISSVAIARMDYKVKLIHWLYDNADLKLERKFDLAMQMLEKYEPKLAG